MLMAPLFVSMPLLQPQESGVELCCISRGGRCFTHSRKWYFQVGYIETNIGRFACLFHNSDYFVCNLNGYPRSKRHCLDYAVHIRGICYYEHRCWNNF